MNINLKLSLFALAFCYSAHSQEMKQSITIKSPGNPSRKIELQSNGASLIAQQDIPVDIKQKMVESTNKILIEVIITAKEKVYYNFENSYKILDFKHSESEFLMPGFWYHKNLRSPKEAPSFATSDSWQVREDRLSTPLTGIFSSQNGSFYSVIRLDELSQDAIAQHQSGEVILSSKTDLGFTGFKNESGSSALVFGFPYHEAPKSYIRKLTLIPEIIAFEKLEKGETRRLTWEISKGVAHDYSDFVSKTWTYSYDTQKPMPVASNLSADEAKKFLSNFFRESYMNKFDLKYYSGVHMRTDDCASTGATEVGFIGRVLLNAYNSLEYAEQNGDQKLIDEANSIFDSYLKHGFTNNGFFREYVDFTKNQEENNLSIRRQSEGVFAILNYLHYEKTKGRKHIQWEKRMQTILANFAMLQKSDGSFPRKFDDNFVVKDESGGSTPSATLPLAMAYKYFKNKDYLIHAKKSGNYLENEIINKSDYFSSTLDANCEDKEASLYASTAMHYLAMVTKGNEQQHYIDQSMKAAYFCLTWYYTWDVPFAQGQMLGDVGFQSRGWGNVSVENNHIDVFIFEFAAVLDWLAKERKESRFSDFSKVIKSSMLQLMPRTDHMFNIAKVGYYPEVVQHTNWDYGKNGKGFYNDIFAPGWTVASLWQMLSPSRVEDFFR